MFLMEAGPVLRQPRRARHPARCRDPACARRGARLGHPRSDPNPWTEGRFVQVNLPSSSVTVIYLQCPDEG